MKRPYEEEFSFYSFMKKKIDFIITAVQIYFIKYDFYLINQKFYEVMIFRTCTHFIIKNSCEHYIT